MSRLHNARKRLRDALGPLLFVVLAVLLTAAPGSASAQTAPANPEAASAVTGPGVQVSARVFLATDGPPPPEIPAPTFPPDAKVEVYVAKLRQLLRYRQYHPLQVMLGRVPVGATHRTVLAGDRRLELTPEGTGERLVRLRVRLLRGNLTEVVTHVSATPGTPMVIGGPRYGDGVLIILLWANPDR